MVGQYSPLPSGGETHKQLAGVWHHLLDEHLLVISLTIGTWAGRGRVRAYKGPWGLQTPQYKPFSIAELAPRPRSCSWATAVGQRQRELGACKDEQHPGLSEDGNLTSVGQWESLAQQDAIGCKYRGDGGKPRWW